MSNLAHIHIPARRSFANGIQRKLDQVPAVFNDKGAVKSILIKERPFVRLSIDA
jgi:hypothetical protein